MILLRLIKVRLPQLRLLSTANRVVASDEISLCVLGNGAEGNPRSLFINYNNRIFMFNCGEGLQRLLPEFGFKSSKVDSLFLTSANWCNISGLASFLLSRYDAGVKHLNIYGQHYKDSIHQCTSFDTKLKRVKYNFIEPENFNYEKLTLNPITIKCGGTFVTVYLGTILAENGKIDLDLCFKLRVPRNLVGELEANRTIMLENGQIVSPSDVSKTDYPNKYFVIFECFETPNLKVVCQSSTICDFFQRSECIVHFTHDSCLDHADYKEFLKRYSSARHLLITERNPSYCLPSVHRFQTQLNMLDPQIFPLLKEQDNVLKEDDNEKLPSTIVHCSPGLSYDFRLSGSSESALSIEKIPLPITINDALLHKDGSSREGLEELIQELKVKQTNFIYNNHGRDAKYPEFVFLGTASSVSLPIRNVPSILVNLSPSSSILLDCGENTYGQLLRFYGVNIKPVLDNLKAIFISHHHSDHHLGLIQLLNKHHQMSSSTTVQKLSVIVPPMVLKFLNNHLHSFERKDCHLIVNRKFDSWKKMLSKQLDVKQIELIPVNHCAFAYGISLVDQNGFKFVYSGDTQPCDNLVKYGNNCNLLIHEATVEDGLVHFARSNFHSTMREAIQVSKSMKAQFTILTHFSQRYGKLPFVPSEQCNSSKVGLAFDNMRVTPRNLVRLPLLYPSLMCMYSKHLDNLKYRSQMYNRKYNYKQT